MITTRKAHMLDVVEMLEDLPEYGVRRGDRGAVVEVFDAPEEAYMVEFVGASGTSSRVADWVKPDQFINTYTTAKQVFEQGMAFLNEGNLPDAERKFRRAIDLKPDYLGVLHNSVVKSFEESDDWQRRITAMRLVLRMNPNYRIARDNLAIAYLNFGVQRAQQEDVESARDLYHIALGIEPSPEIVCDLRRNLAAAYTELGVRAHRLGAFEESVGHMGRACAFDPNTTTRRNLGLAYAFLAWSLLTSGQAEESIFHFEGAEDTGLLLPELLNDYGIALAISGRLERAVRAFERALELAPTSSAIQANLSLAMSKSSNEFLPQAIQADFKPAPPAQPQEYLIAA